MDDREKFSLGEDYPAESAYRDGESIRSNVCNMGRMMAELTIPSVFPPEGYQVGDDLPGNNQSISAMAVNTLASALMFMAFPPGQPIMRLKPEVFKVQGEIDQDPQMYANLLLAMSSLEIAHREKLQTTPIATAYVGLMKLLLVAGNALWKHIKLKEPTYHRPDCYVVKRNSGGLPLRTIHKECVTFETLDKEHQDQIRPLLSDQDWKKTDGSHKKDFEVEVEVYSVMKYHKASDGEETWLYWQECKGVTLEDTEVETDFDNPPMWPAWLIPEYGQDWGRSYCEEYRGDLYTLEAHASSINDGASLAALSLLFVKPGGTSVKQVRQARNLSVLSGDANDLSVFRSDKTGDFNFVVQNYLETAKRVSAAFLMQSSIQRNGERVTAEEIRRLGQELDKAMGGLYTSTATGTQKVVIQRAVALNEDETPELPAIPRDIVKVEVITGVDALGQSTEAENLTEYATAARTAFPTKFEQTHDAHNFFTRLAAARGVKPDGLVLSAEQVQADNAAMQEQAAQQTVLDKGTGPAVKGLADFAAQGGDITQTLQ